MATLLNQRVPAGGMAVGGAEQQFITDASGNEIGSVASDMRSAMATLLSISEADALNIGIADMFQRYADAGFPTAP